MTDSESLRKILKNRKYYFKIFGEIGFKKFDVVFKLKILKSFGDTADTRIGQILINLEKSQNIYLDRK